MPMFQEEYFRICHCFTDLTQRQSADLFGFNTHLALKEAAQAVS